MTDPQVAQTRWWWIRHAPVVDAHLQHVSGQSDIDADVSDAAAFAALAAHLPQGAVWVTSHLARTAQTAQALKDGGADVAKERIIEPAFAEQAFGDWTGLTWAEIGEKPDAQAFWDAPADIAPPSHGTGLKSESFADVCRRAAMRIEGLTHDWAGRDIVCVAHAGTIRAAVALALGLTPDQALGLDVKNLGLTRLDHVQSGLRVKRGGHWRVVGVNQVC